MSTPLPSSFDNDSDFYEENRWQKFSRRLKEEPLIPLGCVLTCWALFGASRSIRAGDHNRTNRMFRARIYAQGFTLVAMVAGSMYWQTDRQKRKEFDTVVAEKKAKEKNAAWIRELEVRDEEEKELKAERMRRMQRLERRKAGTETAMDVADEKKGVLDRLAEKEGKGDAVGEDGKKKGVLESTSGMMWAGKK